jgi:hypothetical protein
MGVFFSPSLASSAVTSPASIPVSPAAIPVPAAASPTHRPSSVPSRRAAGRSADQPARSAELRVYWGRLVFASVVLLVILIGGFTAAILKLDTWSTLLIHSFELLLGIFVGLLGGDIASRRDA